MSEQDVVQAMLAMAGVEIAAILAIWGAIRAKSRIMGSQDAKNSCKSRESEEFRAIF